MYEQTIPSEEAIRKACAEANVFYCEEWRDHYKPDAQRLVLALARRIEAEPAPDVGNYGWIVGNSDGTKWRRWAVTGPGWTYDPTEAIRYARREDAEMAHIDDEDAWRVVRYASVQAYF